MHFFRFWGSVSQDILEKVDPGTASKNVEKGTKSIFDECRDRFKKRLQKRRFFKEQLLERSLHQVSNPAKGQAPNQRDKSHDFNEVVVFHG